MIDQFPDAQAQAYIQWANQQIQNQLIDDKRFAPTQAAILKQLQNDKNIPFCEEYYGKMYHFFQDEQFPKGVYRVCLSSAYRAGNPHWQILFSVADFDDILSEEVYLSGIAHCTLNPNKVLLSLAPGGQDAEFTLEFDLQEQKLVEGGFHFPLGKNHIHWRDENSVWVCPAWHPQQLTEAGYPSEVWLLARNQSFEEATPVFKTEPEHLLVRAWRYLDGQGSPVDLIEAASSFFQKKYYLVQSDLSVTELLLPEQCEVVGYLNGQILLHLQQDWVRANQQYPSGALIAVNLHKGVLGPAHLLFTPDDKQTIETVETSRRFIILHYLENVQSHLKAWCWQHGSWLEHILPDLPQGTIELIDQPWGGDLLYFTVEDFLTPSTLLVLDLACNELCLLRRAPQQFSAQGLSTHQFFAQSADGTQIPYFWTGREATPDTPTLIYVYGGFGLSELPYYLGNLGTHWLNKGGALVVANVRGGGEFGPKWHQAAQKQNKHKSVDDLIAVIDDLIQSGKSSAGKIALQGGSNGGLLVASAMVCVPQKIGAVISEVPLTDMLNFHYYSVGKSWLEEYGNPDHSDDRTALSSLSPLHQLKAGVTYPPVLITSSLSDDRVHPIHAFLFADKLTQLEQNSLFYMAEEGGHSGNHTQEQTAYELAMVLIFLYQKFHM